MLGDKIAFAERGQPARSMPMASISSRQHRRDRHLRPRLTPPTYIPWDYVLHPAPHLPGRHVRSIIHRKPDHRGIVQLEACDADEPSLNKVAFPEGWGFLIGVAMKLSALLFAVAFLACGCSSVHTTHDPRVKVGSFQRFFVQHRLTDDHHIDETIVAELKALGREASAGPVTMMPDDAEILVTYEDTWAWDFKSYLIQLNITLQRARRDEVVALGSYRQPTPIPKPPAEVVHAILAPLFKSR